MTSLFTCPRPGCGHVTKNPALARLGYCEKCQGFTGLCGAADIAVALYTHGLVTIPDWPHPCTAAGTELWRMTGPDGAETDVVFCTAHGGRLRAGAGLWMSDQRLRLGFLAPWSGGPVRA